MGLTQVNFGVLANVARFCLSSLCLNVGMQRDWITGLHRPTSLAPIIKKYRYLKNRIYAWFTSLTYTLGTTFQKKTPSLLGIAQIGGGPPKQAAQKPETFQVATFYTQTLSGRSARYRFSWQVVHCPTQLICAWIFICWVGGGDSIQGVVKCSRSYLMQEGMF